MAGDRVDVGRAYAEAHARFMDLGRSLDDEQAATPVPALPGWTVKDTFAHVTALATEIVEGRGVDGVPGEERTEQGVRTRSSMALPEVLDEWMVSGPRFAALLTRSGSEAPPNPVLDVWAHEIDVRGTLGMPVPADGGAAEEIFNRIVRRAIGRRWPDEGIAALRIVLPDEEWIAGEGEPAGSLSIGAFELGRVFLGRRSPEQMAALAWEGADPAPWIAAIPVFGPADVDVVDPPRARS